jgi:hypothetical protein
LGVIKDLQVFQIRFLGLFVKMVKARLQISTLEKPSTSTVVMNLSVHSRHLIASGGSPEEVRSIYKNTAPQVNGVTFMDSDYTDEMEEEVKDAIRAEARTMPLAELRKYVREFPELQALLKDRESKIKKSIRHCVEDEVQRGNLPC